MRGTWKTLAVIAAGWKEVKQGEHETCHAAVASVGTVTLDLIQIWHPSHASQNTQCLNWCQWGEVKKNRDLAVMSGVRVCWRCPKSGVPNSSIVVDKRSLKINKQKPICRCVYILFEFLFYFLFSAANCHHWRKERQIDSGTANRTSSEAIVSAHVCLTTASA